MVLLFAKGLLDSSTGELKIIQGYRTSIGSPPVRSLNYYWPRFQTWRKQGAVVPSCMFFSPLGLTRYTLKDQPVLADMKGVLRQDAQKAAQFFDFASRRTCIPPVKKLKLDLRKEVWSDDVPPLPEGADPKPVDYFKSLFYGNQKSPITKLAGNIGVFHCLLSSSSVNYTSLPSLLRNLQLWERGYLPLQR